MEFEFEKPMEAYRIARQEAEEAYLKMCRDLKEWRAEEARKANDE